MSYSRALQIVLSMTQNWLNLLVENPNFFSVFTQAFGNGIDRAEVEAIVWRWRIGDLSDWPEIKVLTENPFERASGGYVESTNTIYLHLPKEAYEDPWTHTIATDEVLLEAVGHFLDAQLNATDSPGDEGAIFSALMRGEVLSERRQQQLRAEDSRLTLVLDGQPVSIEQANLEGRDDADDKLIGSITADYLRGYAGNDRISSQEGNDIIDGGEGDDLLVGHAGDDTLFGGDGIDEIHGGDGNDTIDAGAGDEKWILGGKGNDTIYTGDGDDVGMGEAGDDVIFGGNGWDTLFGGDGDDTLYGGDGYDVLYSEAGNDTLIGGSGRNNLIGGEGNDTYIIGDSNESSVIIFDAAGTDTLQFANVSPVPRLLAPGVMGFYRSAESLVIDSNQNGEADGDVVWITRFFADSITNSPGVGFIETIGDFSGTDILKLNFSRIVLGGDKDDALSGKATNDTLIGGAGDDRLNGGGGNDTISGGTEADLIVGGTGADLLTGGEGADDFQFGDVSRSRTRSTGRMSIDRITDFERGEDSIVLSRSAFGNVKRSDFKRVNTIAQARNSTAEITYIRKTGALFYNQNGAAKGFGSGGQFADLTDGLRLTTSDFSIAR
ncbi:calcium-binding protein [Microcoleus sp. FACHB-1515]|uniref:calcium-binding protein n=1 Tax=Cyanophyceae TaxID=3028117 RepID=UPI001684E655|nr:calcium-binding protein [Microcoleus sp. FACHB-1515]MBD2092443.1 calcium-binding protein [Microcoleus sp. FACHB-1515]